MGSAANLKLPMDDAILTRQFKRTPDSRPHSGTANCELRTDQTSVLPWLIVLSCISLHVQGPNRLAPTMPRGVAKDPSRLARSRGDLRFLRMSRRDATVSLFKITSLKSSFSQVCSIC
jgi:hypothetical protein